MRYQKEVSPKSLKKREKCDKWTEYEGPELLTYLTIELRKWYAQEIKSPFILRQGPCTLLNDTTRLWCYDKFWV